MSIFVTIRLFKFKLFIADRSDSSASGKSQSSSTLDCWRNGDSAILLEEEEDLDVEDVDSEESWQQQQHPRPKRSLRRRPHVQTPPKKVTQNNPFLLSRGASAGDVFDRRPPSERPLPRSRTDLEFNLDDGDDKARREDEQVETLLSTFDQKIRLLLDPDYQSQSNLESVTEADSEDANASYSSIHSTPSKPQQPRPRHPQQLRPKQSRIFDLVEANSRYLNRQQEQQLQEPRQPRRSAVDLRRGRHFVDKNRHHQVQQQRKHRFREGFLIPPDFDSDRRQMTKTEKDRANEQRIKGLTAPPTTKLLKTLANQKRIRRRHTVGGTRDFGEWEQVLLKRSKTTNENRAPSAWDRLEPLVNDPDGLNVDRSIETWLRRSRKNNRSQEGEEEDSSTRTSPSSDSRRLSFPGNAAEEQRVANFLESQV